MVGDGKEERAFLGFIFQATMSIDPLVKLFKVVCAMIKYLRLAT